MVLIHRSEKCQIGHVANLAGITIGANSNCSVTNYANHPWSVTKPEAVGAPGWQTGTKALCLYCQSPKGLQAHPQGTDLADNSLTGVECKCTAHHPGSGAAVIIGPMLSAHTVCCALCLSLRVKVRKFSDGLPHLPTHCSRHNTTCVRFSLPTTSVYVYTLHVI